MVPVQYLGDSNMETSKPEPTIRRIGGYLNRVVPITDSAGKVVNYALKPLMVEFHPRDLMQVIVGASILAVPVAMTEETWVLGTEMPLRNVLMLSGLSLLFIAVQFQGPSLRIHQTRCGDLPVQSAGRRAAADHHPEVPVGG
jgi:hypothetical protein